MTMTRPLAALFSALLCALLAAIAPAAAQTHRDKGCSTPTCTIIPGIAPIYAYNSAGIGQYALSVATATNLMPPTGATIAQICVETAPVRYRDDGIAPTASVGIPLAAGWCGPYAGPLSAIQFIAQSGSPTIDVSFYYSN
jgi:hypothetical protein